MSSPPHNPASGPDEAANRIQEVLVVRARLRRAIEARQQDVAHAMALWLRAGARTYGDLGRGAAGAPSPDEEGACLRVVQDLVRWLRDPEHARPADWTWPNLERRRAAQLSCSAVAEFLRAEGALANLAAGPSRLVTTLLERYFIPFEQQALSRRAGTSG